MKKENIVHLHNGVLLSFKKKWHPDIYREMDGTGKKYWILYYNPDSKVKDNYVKIHKARESK